MKIKLLSIIIVLSQLLYSQEKITISGTIKDFNSTETLIGVNIYIPQLKIGTSSNAYGFYSLTIPSGNYTMQISALGYKYIEENISLSQSIKKDFNLIEESQTRRSYYY